MNKIEKLIAELCPQGVEFKRLGEITREYNLRNKDGFIKEVRSVTNKIGLVSTDDYFNNKRTSQDTSNYKVVKPNMFVYNPARINIGSIALLKEKIQVIVSPMYVVFEIDKSKIIPEYLDLFISSESGKYQILNRVEVGARFRLPYESLSKIEIPLPPLVIQQKIVSILDKFTQLEAELVLRKKQYEYYRNQLLTPINVNGQWLLNGKKVEWKKLGEIGEFYSGISGKNKNDFINGNAKFITYLNVYSNIAINTNIDTFVKIDENENQNKIEYGDVLFTGSSETLEECGISSVMTKKIDEPLYLNSFCFGFRFHDKNLLLPEFTKYLFRAEGIRKQIIKTANGVTRFNISKKLFANIQIPLPPLSEQERIVEILDKFEALVNDISIGLPAEIEARRKQYEYYRNQLLTFKRKEG